MGRILIRGEPGAEIVPECAPIAGEMVVDKPGKGMFYATEVEAMLKNRDITQLVFAGVTTEVCVQTSMREANDRGYECLLIEDATASYFPRFKAAALEMIRAQGAIVGWTTPLRNLRQGRVMTEPPFDADALIDASLPLLRPATWPKSRARW